MLNDKKCRMFRFAPRFLNVLIYCVFNFTYICALYMLARSILVGKIQIDQIISFSPQPYVAFDVQLNFCNKEMCIADEIYLRITSEK